jgi:hypothetical protein
MVILGIIMAATMDITPTDPSSGWRGRLAGFAVSLALGGALLVMAPPRVLSALSILEADRVINAAETGSDVPRAVLTAASRQAVQEAGRGFSSLADDLAGRSLVLLALQQGPDSVDGQATLTAARTSLRQALAGAPLAPYEWHRLAYVDYASHRFHDAVAAWYMSVRTGAFDPVLIPIRFESGLVFYPYMDIRSRQAFAGQVQLYAGWGLHALIQHALKLNAVETVRPILASEPAMLAEFDRLLPLLKARQ